MKQPSPLLPPPDLALAALVAGLGLALYVRTLAPGLLLADSAEFQTLAYTLGMTHPTGYPVYLLAAHLFTRLPLGELAYRVNLFSAVLGGLALGLVYLDARLLGSRRMAALGAALVLGLSQVFWWQAVIAELYAAAAALVAGITFLLLLWRRSGRWGYLAGAGLLGGLSLGVHNTVALAAPAVLLYLLLAARRRRDWLAASGGAALGLALTLSAFAYVDARDTATSYYQTTLIHGRSVWDLSPEQVNSFTGRLAYLYGARQFRMYMFSDPLENIPPRALSYAESLLENFSPAALLLATAGAVLLLAGRARRPEGALILLAWASMLVFILNYGIWDIQVFYIPTFVWLALAVAVGGSALLSGIDWALQRLPLGQAGRAVTGALAGLLLLVFLLAPQAPVAAASWTAGRLTFLEGTPWSGWPYPVASPQAHHNQAAFLVDNLEEDAIVFTSWDMLYAYLFVAHVEQNRTGLAFHEWFVQDGQIGLAESTSDYIAANLGQRPIYFDSQPPENARARFEFRSTWRLPWLYQVTGRR